jgi:hypothetical protein
MSIMHPIVTHRAGNEDGDTPSSDLDEEGYEDLKFLEELEEEENEGLNTRSLLMIILFIAVAAVLLFIILGFFGYLAQGEYGGP